MDTVWESAAHDVVGVVRVTPSPAVVPTLLVATTPNRYVVPGLSPLTVAETCDEVEPAEIDEVFVAKPYAVDVPYWK